MGWVMCFHVWCFDFNLHLISCKAKPCNGNGQNIVCSSLYLFVGHMVESGTKVIDFAKVLRALFLSPG